MGSVAVSRVRGRAVVRDRTEDHRASTPLELFFDLTFVVAVGRAATALHEQLAEDHLLRGIGGFVVVFFAVWWGWMGYTWFASAHDSDDVAHRLLTLLQMAGALVMAAGVGRVVTDDDFAVVVLGYTIMRVGLIWSWLRVARDQPATRGRALRYAGSLVVLQCLWILGLAVDGDGAFLVWAVLVPGEVVAPMWAERTQSDPIFHAGHIEERYGLFTIILLGESILSATVGFQAAFDEGGLTGDLAAVGIGGLVIAFAAWWLYFDHPGHLTPTPDQAFRWGYSHVVIFASLAATGAGIHLAAGAVGGHGSARTAALAVSFPVAGYVSGLALVMAVTGVSAGDVRIWSKALGATAVMAIGLVATIPVAVVGCAAVLTLMSAAMVLSDPTADTPADHLGD